MSSSSEHDLVRRIRAGDPAAFEELFHLYQPKLVTFVYGYTRDAEAARDVVSDVFLQLWRNHGDWQPEQGIATYLYGAARNRAHSHARSRLRAERGHASAAREFAVEEAGAPAMSTQPPSAQEQIEKAEELELVWRAVEALPENQREVITLRWRDKLEFHEIASILGVSKPAAQMQLSRAIAALRKALLC